MIPLIYIYIYTCYNDNHIIMQGGIDMKEENAYKYIEVYLEDCSLI